MTLELSQIPIMIWFMTIPSVIAIAYLDYIIFSNYIKCDNCGYKVSKWYSFMLPSLIEMLLFLSGIGLGFLYAKGV
jgi:hypothetical protein